MTPALLHVSSDARAFALGYYELSFAGFLMGPVFFNWASDTLYFKTERDLHSFFQLERFDNHRTIAALKHRGEQISEIGENVQNL